MQNKYQRRRWRLRRLRPVDVQEIAICKFQALPMVGRTRCETTQARPEGLCVGVTQPPSRLEMLWVVHNEFLCADVLIGAGYLGNPRAIPSLSGCSLAGTIQENHEPPFLSQPLCTAALWRVTLRTIFDNKPVHTSDIAAQSKTLDSPALRALLARSFPSFATTNIRPLLDDYLTGALTNRWYHAKSRAEQTLPVSFLEHHEGAAASRQCHFQAAERLAIPCRATYCPH
jgi:hypothetical protein